MSHAELSWAQNVFPVSQAEVINTTKPTGFEMLAGVSSIAVDHYVKSTGIMCKEVW
eukprot:CAMPEP_0174383996 /NCGR_PEP_ID=MMETSP0811_2-20130205/125616_1 /TAXON_ID=73025 ORGANISM="Eutreptiella gymnastica-like, Strain CCMP1594" /NCGR_SAMPLE_ID=MMETSP0811_2 /ASSEMBLY_ACC=CAM_ASM_000667 /LENGTH=55 /DNA_ID=CAMNT_0015537795 /DNA_START=1923 /DNA_END=2087 /DNA_ORIENTATION=-